MKQIDLPILRMINKFIGAKMSAALAAIIVVLAQFSEFRSAIDNLAFAPGLVETLTQYVKDMGVAESLPAPLAALLAFYTRKAGNDTIITDRGDATEVIDTGRTLSDSDNEFLSEGLNNGDPDCDHERTIEYNGILICRDCPGKWLQVPEEKEPMAQEDVLKEMRSMFADNREETAREMDDLVDKIGLLDVSNEELSKAVTGLRYDVDRKFISMRSQLEHEINKRLDEQRTVIEDDVDLNTVEPVVGGGKPIFADDWEVVLPEDTNEDLERYFGEKGENQVRLHLPYAMKLAWDNDAVINSFMCHNIVHDPLLELFNGVLEVYTPEQIAEYGLDQFGGCLNVREMKGSGGKRWSTHSWGMAIDMDPMRNQYKWDSSKATMASDELRPFREIAKSVGFLSAGEFMDRDWMHFQYANYKRG